MRHEQVGCHDAWPVSFMNAMIASSESMLIPGSVLSTICSAIARPVIGLRAGHSYGSSKRCLTRLASRPSTVTGRLLFWVPDLITRGQWFHCSTWFDLHLPVLATDNPCVSAARSRADCKGAPMSHRTARTRWNQWHAKHRCHRGAVTSSKAFPLPRQPYRSRITWCDSIALNRCVL